MRLDETINMINLVDTRQNSQREPVDETQHDMRQHETARDEFTRYMRYFGMRRIDMTYGEMAQGET